MPRAITDEEKQHAQSLLDKARAAMKITAPYDQARVDDLCRAVGWAIANEKTFVALTVMGVEESNMGSVDGAPARRFKIVGILARRAATKKRRRDRGDSGKRHRQIRKAGRRDRRLASGHQSSRHHGRRWQSTP